jgi:hypothetical protein
VQAALYRTDLETRRALTLIRKLNECTLLNDQYLVAYARKASRDAAPLLWPPYRASLNWRRAAQRNVMTYSAQEFESDRFLEYVRFAVMMINNDDGELDKAVVGLASQGQTYLKNGR